MESAVKYPTNKGSVAVLRKQNTDGIYFRRGKAGVSRLFSFGILPVAKRMVFRNETPFALFRRVLRWNLAPAKMCGSAKLTFRRKVLTVALYFCLLVKGLNENEPLTKGCRKTDTLSRFFISKYKCEQVVSRVLY